MQLKIFYNPVSSERRKVSGFSCVHIAKEKCLLGVANLNYLTGKQKVRCSNWVPMESERGKLNSMEVNNEMYL